MKLVIIGANGQMGQLMLRLFAPYFNVVAFDQADWGNAEEILSHADFILLAVSMHHTAAVIDQLAPYLNSHHKLFDITSIKAPIFEQMQAVHNGPVMGTHPIFGPGIRENKWPWVICPAHNDNQFQPVEDAIADLGFDIHHMTGDEHDIAMDVIQGVNYAVLSAYIEVLDESVWETSAYADLIRHYLSEDPKLYQSIIHATPERVLRIQGFAQNSLNILDELGKNYGSCRVHEPVSSTLTLLEAMQPEFITDKTRAIASPNFRFKQNYAKQLQREGCELVDSVEVRQVLNRLLKI